MQGKKKVIMPVWIPSAQWFLCHNMTVLAKADFRERKD